MSLYVERCKWMDKYLGRLKTDIYFGRVEMYDIYVVRVETDGYMLEL